MSGVLVSVVMLACTSIETTLVFYPSLGRLQAEFDHRLGEKKYYFYGYIDLDKSDLMSEKLRQKNVKAIFRGCEIGGPDYYYEMAYNETVSRYLSVDDLRFVRRRKEIDL
jgi:hypothetical protein